MAVTIDEINGSPHGQYNDGRYEVVRDIVVAWTDLETYIAELVPPPLSAGNTVLQQPAALLPGSTHLRVASFDWNPHFTEDDKSISATVDGINVYENVKFTIIYATPPSAQNGGDLGDPGGPTTFDPVPFLEHDIKHGGKFLKVPPGNYQFVNSTGTTSAIPDNVPLGVFVSTTQHNVKWPNVITPNWDNLEKFKGSVNSVAIRLRGYPYPKGTLLYLGYDGKETVMTDGSLAWDLMLHFESEQKDVSRASLRSGDTAAGYNYFWSETSKLYEKVEKKSSADGVYPENDMSLLYTAGT